MKVTCIQCHKDYEVPITEAQLVRWRSGNEHIQHIVPEMSPALREMLISGICGVCFDAMFGEEERTI
jgi:hypothetical protein